MASVRDFSTASEWVAMYQKEAERLLGQNLGSNMLSKLRARMDAFATSTLEESCVKLKDSARYDLPIFLSGMATAIPVAGSPAKRLITRGGIWLVIDMVIHKWGVSNRKEVAEIYKEAIKKSGEFPKPSSWLAMLVNEQLDKETNDRLKDLAVDYWNQEDVTEKIHDAVASEFGLPTADAFISHSLKYIPLLGELYRIGKTWVDNIGKMKEVIGTLKEKILPIHKDAFVRAAIWRAL
jgi:hypothetical protein